MPVLTLYVSDHDHQSLTAAALETGRGLDELAESAISEAACNWRRDQRPPITEADTIGRKS
jgi:hypothetical protein